MQNYSKLSIQMKTRFAHAKTYTEKQRIVDSFVKKLRIDGLNNEEIIKVGKIERLRVAQGNREMISNTDAYKKALEKALGKKMRFIKKPIRKTYGEKK